MSANSAIPDSVIERLEDAEAQMSESDGVRYFNKLYLAVAREIAEAEFEDPASLRVLETNFVDLYFDALALEATAPRSWRPLFESRFQTGILPLQFALAGMNAHINRDLPVALVRTWDELGLEPGDDGPFLRDYESMNGLLATVEHRMRPEFIPEEFQRFPESMARLADLLAIWNIEAARETALWNGGLLWSVRESDILSKLQLNAVDRTFGVVSRALLRPIR